jgi:hypothetical protein
VVDNCEHPAGAVVRLVHDQATSWGMDR